MSLAGTQLDASSVDRSANFYLPTSDIKCKIDKGIRYILKSFREIAVLKNILDQAVQRAHGLAAVFSMRLWVGSWNCACEPANDLAAWVAPARPNLAACGG